MKILAMRLNLLGMMMIENCRSPAGLIVLSGQSGVVSLLLKSLSSRT